MKILKTFISMESQKLCVFPCIIPQKDLFSSRIFCPYSFLAFVLKYACLKSFPPASSKRLRATQTTLCFLLSNRSFLPSFLPLVDTLIYLQGLTRYLACLCASLVIGRYLFRISLWALTSCLNKVLHGFR